MELKLKKLSKEEIINNPYGEYNQREWEKTINRFSMYGECKFFERVESTNSYPEFFAVYVADGIRFFNSVSFSSCLSNSTFAITQIAENENGIMLKPMSQSRIENNKRVREYMRSLTETTPLIFTSVI